MVEALLAAVTALWLGVLTSISPCPLATNIAAISYISRRVDSPTWVIWSGLAYTLGRMLSYLILGILLVQSLLTIPALSLWLQTTMNKFLGPMLIVVGMLLLEMIPFPSVGGGWSGWIERRVETWGIWGACLLGMVFALSFCPVSAALFFGSLIPLAVQYESGALIPSIYGVGAALPVAAFALMIAFGARSLSRTFQCVTQVERWARTLTGGVFILVGVYMSLVYIFGLGLG